MMGGSVGNEDVIEDSEGSGHKSTTRVDKRLRRSKV
jgi:hypothetical protein